MLPQVAIGEALGQESEHGQAAEKSLDSGISKSAGPLPVGHRR